MNESLTIIVVAVTILSLVFLFLYVRKAQELTEVKIKLDYINKTGVHDEDVQKARDDFLAMIVHDLRSPLAVIKGSADLILKEKKHLTETQIDDMLDMVRTSATSLLKMVNDLLDVSKIESGKFEINLKDHSINRIIKDELHTYEVFFNQSGVEVSTQLQEGLPHVKIDEDKIKQVFNNLIANAVKFTPKGGKISIVSKRQGNDVQISVSDTGPGISDSLKAKLFHKYVQGQENGVRHEKGTGLGLFIAKGIVEAHRGTMWVEDSTPHGAKFVFTLPLS
jgi:signal transduction histidine kinase